MNTPDASQQWINLAKSDLQSARRLYEQKDYRNAYFLFQQASEKANKALALKLDLFSEKELMTFGHDQMKIYKEIIRRTKDKVLSTLDKATGRTSSLSIKEIVALFESDGFPSRPILSLLELNELKSRDLINMSIEELNEFLDTIDVMDDIFMETATGNSKEAKQMRVRLLASLDIQQLTIPHADSKQSRAAELKVCRLIADLLFITTVCYTCALLTIQHSAKARYPSEGHDPLKIYRGNLPIVRKQGEFMDLLEEAIRLMKRL